MKKSFNQYAMATRQKGFTLIEMAIVLMIIGVLAMASIYGFGVYRTTKNESTARNINTVAASTQGKWKFDVATSGVSATALSTAGVVSASQLNSLGVVSVTGTSLVTAGAYDAFTVAVANVNKAECSDLARNVSNEAMSLVAHNASAGITAGSVMGISVSFNGIDPSLLTGVQIDTACAAITSQVGQLDITYPKNPQ